MSLVNKVLGKDEKEKKKDKKKDKKKKEKKAKKSKPKKSKKKKTKKPKKKISSQGIAHRVLIKPVITEKATRLQSQGIYSFYVKPEANKIEVKKAVKEVFDVEPEKVRTIKIPGKSIRRGLTQGRTKDRKKALVFLSKGDKIELVRKK